MNTKTAVRLLVSITGVMFLFGLSWLFGALTITVQAVRLTFQILFAIFTSLQGFFIFLFLCVFSKEARELWKEFLSCGRYKSKFLNPKLSTDKNFKPKHVNSRPSYSSKPTEELHNSLKSGISQTANTDHVLETSVNNTSNDEGSKNTSLQEGSPCHMMNSANVHAAAGTPETQEIQVDFEGRENNKQNHLETEVVVEEVKIEFT